MSGRLRLADLLGGLSIVADLGYGLPIETTLQSCLIGTALARRMDLPARDVADVFYDQFEEGGFKQSGPGRVRATTACGTN